MRPGLAGLLENEFGLRISLLRDQGLGVAHFLGLLGSSSGSAALWVATAWAWGSDSCESLCSDGYATIPPSPIRALRVE